jgi:transposase
VRARTKAKNECHAVLARNLEGRPPMSDVFGKQGRRWLSALELLPDEAETVHGCLREVDFLDSEIALVERELAAQALCSPEIRRLMTVPGVSLVSAATFVAVVGDVKRFSSPKKLVSYVGLDPKVRQSGEAPARHGRISKQGSAPARHMLCEAAWVLIRAPGPLHAFYERVRARRGAQIALVATARKLSVLFWHLLTKEEDYAFERPTLTRRKLRGLELKAKDGRRSWPSGHALSTQQDRAREAEFARPRRPIAGSSPTGSPEDREAVRARYGGALLQVIFLAKRQLRGRDQPQNLRFSSSSPAPAATLAERRLIV